MAYNNGSSKSGDLAALPKATGCRSNGGCGSYDSCNKLAVFDWLAQMELPEGQREFDCVEVRFKNSTKGFYRNVNHLQLILGESIAVEASPGHDIGIVSLTGELVRLQMKKKKINPNSDEIKKVYRKATTNDVKKWKEVQKLEESTMFKARTIASDLKLNMKISDVEYQGDKTKVIFYFTADERVDFRELIKKLVSEFQVRVEMRQLGMRQEAGRLGGIGDCGRELCCSTWLTDFKPVSTSAARYQQLSLNPQKLSGQCGKLKCCLNYELDSYLDAIKNFPGTEIKLETKKGIAHYQKMDIFKGMMWYYYAEDPQNIFRISVDKAKKIIELNKKGKKSEDLIDLTTEEATSKKEMLDFKNVVGQDSLTRFERKKALK